MSQVAASSTSGGSGSSPRAEDQRVQGRRLVLVRVAWVAAALLGVGAFAARLPAHYAYLQRVCTTPACAYGQLTPQAAHSFALLGLSVGTYAILRVGLTLLVALTCYAIATILAWRKTDDWLTLLVALWIVCVGTATITGAFGLATGTTIEGHEISAQVVNGLAEFGTCLLVLALFPTRRIVPRAAFLLLVGVGLFVSGPSPVDSPLTLPLRLGVLAGLMVAQIYHIRRVSSREQQQQRNRATLGISVLIGAAMVFLVLAAADQLLTALATLAALLFYAAVIASEVVQLSRYWQVAGPVARQQTKWIAFGLAVFVTMAAALLAPALVLPSLHQRGSIYETLHTLVMIVVSLIMPVSITIAILRYRLWDIDGLINRALVYGSLTGLLGILYFGLLIGLEGLAGLVTTQASQPVVLVVSTLAIAALVQPLRGRLQNIIDRRFYRRKYDAEKTLAAFSAALQREVDLEQVRQSLLTVVDETMRPVGVSLWLRQQSPDERM